MYIYITQPKRIVREIVTKKAIKTSKRTPIFFLQSQQYTTCVNIESGFSVRQTCVDQLLERF